MNFEVTADGLNHHIFIDGLEIIDCVSLNIDMAANGIPDIELRLVPEDLFVYFQNATIKLDHATQLALKKMGWIPPLEKTLPDD